MTDFSISKVTEDQVRQSQTKFTHKKSTDWAAIGYLIFNIIVFIVFVIYYFVHKHHHSIQHALNETGAK